MKQCLHTASRTVNILTAFHGPAQSLGRARLKCRAGSAFVMPHSVWAVASQGSQGSYFYPQFVPFLLEFVRLTPGRIAVHEGTLQLQCQGVPCSIVAIAQLLRRYKEMNSASCGGTGFSTRRQLHSRSMMAKTRPQSVLLLIYCGYRRYRVSATPGLC